MSHRTTSLMIFAVLPMFCCAGDPATAAVAREQRFHVAFVDMRMPGWDGLATIEQLWRVQPELEVAISSAYMDHSWNTITERLQRPGLRLVPKPWKGSEILAALHELRSRARRRSVQAPF